MTKALLKSDIVIGVVIHFEKFFSYRNTIDNDQKGAYHEKE